MRKCALSFFLFAALLVVGLTSGATHAASSPCEDGTAVASHGDNPALVADCNILLAAKDALAGDAVLNWDAAIPIAAWDGVDVSGEPPRVRTLDLPRRGLAGQIPARLAGLDALWRLDLSFNQLSGPIPAALGDMRGLWYLWLHQNRLDGPIPATLGSLGKLRSLALSNNQLSGPIPASLGSLPELQSLWLQSNALSGPIPAELGALSTLRNLALSHNQLSGPIPAELGGLRALTTLYLRSNDLGGPIPPALAELEDLAYLEISRNPGLSGCVPPALRDVPSTDLDDLPLPDCPPPPPPPVEEPQLVLGAGIPTDTAAALRAEFQRGQDMLRERFRAEPLHYTVYVPADEEAAFALMRRLGRPSPLPGACKWSLAAAIVVPLTCREHLAGAVAEHHLDQIVRRLLVSEAFRYRSPENDPRGPYWYEFGAEAYVFYAYRSALGLDALDEARRREIARARQTSEPLSRMESHSGAAGTEGALALGFLAADWLVQRAGEPALFEYYRLLPSSESWGEAFEGAFGITVADFYVAFEEYRAADFVPRPPYRLGDHAGPSLVLVGEIPADVADRAATEFGALQALFRERFGAGPPEYTVYAVADREAAAREPRFDGLRGHLCDEWLRGVGMVWLLRCRGMGLEVTHVPVSLAWRHFAALRNRLAPPHTFPRASPDHGTWGPVWLGAGVRQYVDQWYRTLAQVEGFEKLRASHAAQARNTARLLRDMETGTGYIAARDGVQDGTQTSLGFLAIDWLVRHAGEPALLQYYRRLPSAGTRQEAFTAAFGMRVDDFYAAFEAYRGEIAPPHPHLVDDRIEPVLVLVGEIPAATVAAARADFQDVQRFFRDRFGAGPVDYTVYVAADDASAGPAGVAVFGEEPEAGFCYVWSAPSRFLMVLDGCARFTDQLVPFHFATAVVQVSRWTSRGPWWLRLGTHDYVVSGYRAEAASETPDQIRDRKITSARLTAVPLRDLGTIEGPDDPPNWVEAALGFLAVDWLVTRASEPALFEYYRLLPTSDSWEEAFEGAFGITIDDFHAAFEEYRAGL